MPDVRLQVSPAVCRWRSKALSAGQDGKSHRANVSQHFFTFQQFFNIFFSFSFFPYVFVRLCFRFCLNWTFVIQGLSSVLKQRDFYDPRFITWIESRFDTYVNFGEKNCLLILVSAFLGKLFGFGLTFDYCWFWVSFSASTSLSSRIFLFILKFQNRSSEIILLLKLKII